MGAADQGSAMQADCPFCQIISGDEPARTVATWDDAMAFFPRTPATLGHTLLIPRRHVPDIWSMTRPEAARLSELALDLAESLRDTLRPDGLNVIQSNGAAATQTVPHLHVHLVPRWTDDRMGGIWPPPGEWPPEDLDDALARVRHSPPGAGPRSSTP
ncbi:HIT family protein [Amycolatopsis magusensis]|uniref:HIT family protein n=1 Tax=Amycolatopsis magusensis TaxID=882444 RepID=UPI0037B4E55E